MHPLLMRIADGTSFFVGMGIVMVAAAGPLWLNRSILKGVWYILALCGAVLVAVSSTPLPAGEYVVWGLFLLAAGVTLQMGRSLWEGVRVRLLAVGLVIALSLMLCLQELRYRWNPRIPADAGRTICVIGDSLSAGMGRGEKVWPVVLAERSGLQVKNLAKGGAKLHSAMAQVEEIPEDTGLVILEIGGNDILGNSKAPTEPAVFHRHLEDLLASLANRGGPLVMFELPLPPLGNGYGRAQRLLAAKYGVTLIPKRHLADTLALPDGTLDGLHLSDKGHRHLAEIIQSLFVQTATARPRESGAE